MAEEVVGVSKSSDVAEIEKEIQNYINLATQTDQTCQDDCCDKDGCENKTCREVMDCEDPDCCRKTACTKKAEAPSVSGQPAIVAVPETVYTVVDELVPLYQEAAARADDLNRKIMSLIKFWAEHHPDLAGKELQYDPENRVVVTVGE